MCMEITKLWWLFQRRSVESLKLYKMCPGFFFKLNMHVILTFGGAIPKLGAGMEKGIVLHTHSGMQTFFHLGDGGGCFVVTICLLCIPWSTALLHYSLFVYPYAIHTKCGFLASGHNEV